MPFRLPSKWTILLAIVSILFATTVVGAASAAASTPEIVNEAGGEVVHKHFVGSTEPEVIFEGHESGVLIRRMDSSASGEVTSRTSLQMTVTYKGCTLHSTGVECETQGEPPGVLVDNLVGKPVFLDESHTEVGLVFETKAKVLPFARCNGAEVGYPDGHDRVVVRFLRQGDESASLGFTCAGPGQQELRSYWEGTTSVTAYLLAHTSGGTRQEACINSGQGVTFEEGVHLTGGNAPIVATTSYVSEGGTAKLSGTVNPNGRPTTYSFYYTTGDVGRYTRGGSAGEGTTPVPVSEEVSGLKPGATVEFHVMASNAGGSSSGSEMTFLDEPALRPAKGSAAFPVAFTSAGPASSLSGSFSTVECQQEAGSGSFTGGKEARITMKLTGCHAAGVECGSEASGEIETKELRGVLVYPYPRPLREAGLLLSPATGETLAEFKCSIVTFKITGSVVGVISPGDTLTNTFSVALKQSSNVQEPAEYEAEGTGIVKATLSCSVANNSAKPCALAASPTLSLPGEEALVEV